MRQTRDTGQPVRVSLMYICSIGSWFDIIWDHYTLKPSHLSLLVGYGINVNAPPDPSEFNLFEYIVSQHYLYGQGMPSVRFLLNTGLVDVNHDYGFVLRYSVDCYLDDVTQALVDFGADIDLAISNSDRTDITKKLTALKDG